MGLQLCFQDNEMRAISAQKANLCEVCTMRPATWEAEPHEEGETIQVCGHCAMYSMKTEWSQVNKEELLHVGRYCQAQALKAGREPPDLDERGRLDPIAAERFMMGVAYTTLLLKKMRRLGRAPE